MWSLLLLLGFAPTLMSKLADQLVLSDTKLSTPMMFRGWKIYIMGEGLTAVSLITQLLIAATK